MKVMLLYLSSYYVFYMLKLLKIMKDYYFECGKLNYFLKCDEFREFGYFKFTW